MVTIFFCFFQNNCLHLYRFALGAGLHIESVFAVLQENVEVFKNEG